MLFIDPSGCDGSTFRVEVTSRDCTAPFDVKRRYALLRMCITPDKKI